MSNRYNYLLELGYSEKEVNSYTHKWNEGIISYIADYSANVMANMQYLKADFDADLLLKLPVFYPETFVMDPNEFKTYFDTLKSEFPNEYADIIEKQFWGYEGFDSVYITLDIIESESLYVPFLEIMSHDEAAIQEAIVSLRNPSTRLYKFIVMLNKAEIDISADDLSDGVLYDLEISKWEVLQNAEFLLEQEVDPEIIADMLWYCPYIMVGSVETLSEALIEQFGEEYAEVMREKSGDDDWGDILCELY